MEGSWKFNEELSTALGSPIPYFEETKYVNKIENKLKQIHKRIKFQSLPDGDM